MQVAVAERLELLDDEGVLEGAVDPLAERRRRGRARGQLVEVADVEGGRERQRRRDVVRVTVVEDLEAVLAKPRGEVVLDPELELDRAVRGIPIEGQQVDVALRRGGRAGQRAPGGLIRLGRRGHGLDLVRDDRDERDPDEHGRDHDEQPVDAQESCAAEPPRTERPEPDQARPAGLVHEARSGDEVDDVTVHQQAERDRRDDERGPRPIADHDREEERRDERHDDDPDQHLEGIADRGVVDVL